MRNCSLEFIRMTLISLIHRYFDSFIVVELQPGCFGDCEFISELLLVAKKYVGFLELQIDRVR
jgi:hypothetical protein